MTPEPHDEASLFGSYHETTRPSVDRVGRLISRVTHPVSHSRRRVVVAGVLAAAAVVIGAVALQRPPSRPETPVASWGIPEGHSEPLPGVALDAAGSGRVTAGGSFATMDWVVGRLGVDVQHGQGLEVEVHTDEATVRVVGTAFEVRRDALGTDVVVQRGIVEVSCASGGGSRVEAGGSWLCEPKGGAGLLGRARALERAGAPPAEWRFAAEKGLADPAASTPVQGELEVVRIRSLLAEQRDAEALAAATSYLRTGYPDRHTEVLALALDLAARIGRCEELSGWRTEAEAVRAAAGCGW